MKLLRTISEVQEQLDNFLQALQMLAKDQVSAT